MRYERNHHIDVIRTLGKDKGWSKHKIKSIKGQVLKLESFEEREKYLRRIISQRQ